jgi:hypothetical protein
MCIRIKVCLSSLCAVNVCVCLCVCLLLSGYPLEVHEVVTPDGYLLRMERIPQPTSTEAVFMMHGGRGLVFGGLGLAWMLTMGGCVQCVDTCSAWRCTMGGCGNAWMCTVHGCATVYSAYRMHSYIHMVTSSVLAAMQVAPSTV